MEAGWWVLMIVLSSIGFFIIGIVLVALIMEEG